jgi:hypothetical protein
MKSLLKFWVLPFFAGLALAISMAMNFIESTKILIIFGYVCLIIEIVILNISINNSNNAKPVIKLMDFGFEIKTWKENPPSVCAYIDVLNEPKEGSYNDVNSMGVFPTIVWTDEHGEVVDKNNGRWFIPNEDMVGAIPLQTVDLDANGLPRRLHFTYNITQNMVLQSFYRTNDNKNEVKQRGETRGYHITISLKDKKSSKAEFYFRVAPYNTEAWPYSAIRIEQLDKPNGKVVRAKKFDLADLSRYEKENELVK